MNIHVVYANVGAINNPQAQIIGAAYQFICQSELHFQVGISPGGRSEFHVRGHEGRGSGDGSPSRVPEGAEGFLCSL